MAFLFLLLYLPGAALRQVAMTDEARYGEIPREMIATGDWVVPHLNGLRYFEKPVLGYWLNAISILVFGQNAFAIRFTSVLAVGLVTILIYRLIRRETDDLREALFGGIIYFMSVLVAVVGLTSVLDSMLTLFVSAAIVFFYLNHTSKRLAHRLLYTALCGFTCGLAFLTKGFIAFAVPVVSIVPFLLWERRWKDLFGMPLLALLVAILLMLPWGIAVHLREPDFWHYFVWEEHLKRFLVEDAQHHQPFWFFIPITLLGALPWTALLPAAMTGWKRSKKGPLFRLALCWFVFPFLFFSASSGKLGTYILPCFPPFAILMAYGLKAYFDQPGHGSFNAGARVLAVLILLLALALAAVQLLPGIPWKAYAAHEGAEWPLLLVGLGGWVFFIFTAIRVRAPEMKVFLFAVGPAVCFLMFTRAVPDQVYEIRSAEPFLRAHAEAVGSDTLLVSDSKRTHAVCWFFKRNDVYVMGNRGEFRYGLGYEDARHRRLEVDRFNALLRVHQGKRSVVWITGRKQYEKFREQLPEPVSVEMDSTTADRNSLVLVRF